VEGLLKKMNIEHRTSNSPQASKHLSASGGSNVEWEKGKAEETKIVIQGSALVFLFDLKIT
jgi:hypothetical protein